MKKNYRKGFYFTLKPGEYLSKAFTVVLAGLLLIQTTSVAQWTRKLDALKKRAECPSVMYQGKIYVFGGFGEFPNIEKNNEVYDPALNKWSLIAPFPAGKEISHQAVVVVDDKIWHIGGRATDAYGAVSSQVIIYDITKNVWLNGPQLKDATGKALTIGGGGAALLGRTLHYFGGFSPTICIDQNKYHLTLDVDKWLANPETTKWENKLAPMPIPRNHLSAVAFGGKIYAFGGQFKHDCDHTDQKYCHAYDPISNKWTRLTDLPAPRSHAEGATFPVDGKLYLVGGQGASDAAQNTVLLFTPEANNGLGSWATSTQYKLPNNYIGISAKVIGGKFIISHGALTYISNERRETYTASITRNTPNKFGFVAKCFNKTVSQGKKDTLKNLLYTIEGAKNYALTSSTSWLKVSKNATGLAIQSGIYIEAIIDATGLLPGSYTATITANGTGTGTTFTSASFCVNLTVSGPQVQSFSLINADTEQPIQTLKNGDALNLATLSTRNLNIRANTNPTTIGSVVFNLTGTQSKTTTESLIPYALFADNNHGDYYAWTPAIGSYTLKATPYSASGGKGTAGTPLIINFSVTNSAASQQSTTASKNIFPVQLEQAKVQEQIGSLKLQIYPNPNLGDKVRVLLKTVTSHEVFTIVMYDASGKIITSKTLRTDTEGTGSIEFPLRGINHGVYIIKAAGVSGNKQLKLLIE
jgi:hypothetical protein